MKFTFGDIVVVDKINIGVIVKCWTSIDKNFNYDVYVRIDNCIKNYKENEIERYMVRHKYLSDEEKVYQFNATHGY